MVEIALKALGNLRALHPAVVSGQLERDLRHQLDRLPENKPRSRAASRSEAAAIAAVRTACAHLATRAYEDAYLALVTAHGMLPRLPHQPT